MSVMTTARVVSIESRRPAVRVGGVATCVVLLVGLMLRGLVVLMVLRQHTAMWLFTRGTEMGMLASSILHGEGLASPFGGHTGPSALVGPAYPLLIAGLFRMFGSFSVGAEIAILLLQVAASLLNVWLVMRLAAMLAGRRAAIGAGVFWACSPPLLWMPTIFWDTTFTTCLLTALVLLTVPFQRNPSRARLCGMSAACGLAALLNPALCLTSLAMLGWMVSRLQVRRLANGLLAAMIFAAVLAPWPIRNALALHAFVPLRTTVGLELWMGNHEGSTGHLEESLFPLFNATELAEYTRVGEVAYNKEKAALAEAYIVASPRRFVVLTMERVGRYWMGTGNRDGSPFFAMQAVSTTLLGFAGLGLLAMRRRWMVMPFLLPVLIFPLPYYVTHAEFRYRLTVDPLLTVLAGIAVSMLASAEARRALLAQLRGVCARRIEVATEPITMPAFLREESGQTVIVGAFAMMVIIAFAGLAIDVGHLRYEKRKLQQAADAAALSAGLEFTQCGTNYGCSAMQTAAQKAAAENGYGGTTLVMNCAGMAVSGVELMLNNGPCVMGASDPNSGNHAYVEAVMKEYATTYFARIVGFNNVPIEVRAEAGKAPAPCIYALDQQPLLSVPSLLSTPVNNGITVVGLASIKAQCPIVDESSTLLDFNCAAGSVSATKIKITGGNSLDLLCPVSPTPQYDSPIPTPADPLAYLPKPSVPSTCTGSPTLGLTYLYINTTVTLQPGRYCGGISIGPLANVTFSPGTYVLTNTGIGALGVSVPLTGGLTIAAGATVYGNGVTFYNEGSNLLPTGGITIAANVAPISNIQLVAPTSGTYAGILFMQDPNDESPAVIAASSAFNTKLEGALYFPTASVTYAVSGNARFNILVAYTINFGVVSGGNTAYENSVFGDDYSQLPGGVSPIASTGAVLVQ